MSDNNRNSQSGQGVDSDLILDLNFVPQWARKPADQVSFDRFKDDSHDSRERGGRRGDRRDRRGGDRGGRDRRQPRRERSGPDSARHSDAPRYRRAREDGGGRPEMQREERSERIPLSVRFLPEQKALSGLMRQIGATKRAYPLVDLASILMSKPGCCFVKLELLPEADENARLYQCKLCRTVALERSEIESHILSDHISDYFEVEEVEGEPPSGSFVCVAKCGLSGVLLGPPNHHSYAESVKRLHAARFSGMDFDDYKSRIKTSHDPEDVERWKQESAKKTVYRLKDAEGEAEELSLRDAERYLRNNVIDKLVLVSRKAALSEEVAHGIRDRSIKRALRYEWQRESRFPLRLSFALRATFKHRNMHIFKVGEGKGMNFVTAVKPTPIDAEHAIPAIRDALAYLNEHPGCTKREMVEALRPGADPESDEVKELLQPLHWLADRGHIIEFFNGTISVPRVNKG